MVLPARSRFAQGMLHRRKHRHTVVLADGSILKTGGRLHKNKQGFDLTSLFVGSEGMLGVITEATLRLIPHPAHRSMLTATFDEFATAALAVQTILNSGHHPSALEITDPFTLKAARDHLGQDAFPEGNAHLIIEIDGRKTSVNNELTEVTEILKNLGALSSWETGRTGRVRAIPFRRNRHPDLLLWPRWRWQHSH